MTREKHYISAEETATHPRHAALTAQTPHSSFSVRLSSGLLFGYARLVSRERSVHAAYFLIQRSVLFLAPLLE